MDPTASELDIHQPSTLYWKAVPVYLRRSDKDERAVDLTVRIIAGFQRANHSQRVLRVYVSSDADLFFLYVLEVNEDDFAALKLDQGILVDFANFPGKIIGLLEKCLACRGEELPRFQAVLNAAPNGQGMFRLVETNDFKQLPHITLLFRPGNDAAVKQFLAFRLTELSTDRQQLSSELSKAQSERNSLQTLLTDTKRQLASAKEAHDKQVLEHDVDIKGREAALAEARARQLEELREQHLRERAEAERKHSEALEAAQQRAAELDSDNQALRAAKYELDSRVSELSHRLGAAEGANRSLTEEVERLRAQAQQLGRDKAERDVEIGEALTKLHALEDKVDTQKEVIAEQADRIRGMEASLRQVEARAEELKAAAQGHEERAREATAEVVKANTIIEKLSSDLRLNKEKMRRKAAIIQRQEEEVAQREAALDESRQQARALQRELDKATADADSLRRECEELKRKLEDSKKQLQGNEQMIRWLNSQITESQLHYSGASGGLASSRYTFRPSAPSLSAPSMHSTGAAGAPAGSATLSSGAAPSLARGIGGGGGASTYRTPATTLAAGGAAGSGLGSGGGFAGLASSGIGGGSVSGLSGAAAGLTPRSGGALSSATGPAQAGAAAPGTGGSGYQSGSFYTGGTYNGGGGYMRQGGGMGAASTGSVPPAAAAVNPTGMAAPRSLNLSGLSLGASSGDTANGGGAAVPGAAATAGQQQTPPLPLYRPPVATAAQ